MNSTSNREGFFRRVVRVVSPTELVTFVFILVILLLTLIFQDRVDALGILANSTILLASIILVNIGRAISGSKWMRALHTFYIIPLVLLVFKTVEKLSYALHGRDYDNVLIFIDRTLFNGASPTIWLYQHFTTFPIFTEIMQLCYFSYYFIPVILAVEFFLRRRNERPENYYRDELETLRFVLIYGLLISYLGYFTLPGIGPRFTVHDFWSISKELPGVWLTEPMRWFINLAENIREGMSSVQAAQAVTRDVFPSGHTILALLEMILAFRFRAKSRWVVLFLGTGLIFSTVYLRYHYVIDLIGGAILAMLALYTAAPAMEFFLRMKTKICARAK